MKHIIYILRHAKSKSGSSDYERKLSKKGVADAKMLAAWMRQFQHRPDTIISSSAVRGRHTARIMAASLSIGEENVSYVQNLYGATTGRWLQRLRRLNERQVQHVLLVGHNPELELLAAKLAAVPQLQLPPCGMVAIQSRYGWAKLGTADSTLLCSHYPERYMELRPEFVSITSQAVQAAVACLPAAARGGNAKHLLGEGIYGAIAKIMAQPKKAASKKKPLPKKAASKAASKTASKAASKKKSLPKKAAKKAASKAASRKKPLPKKTASKAASKTASKAVNKTASRKKPLPKKAASKTASKAASKTASRKKPLPKKAASKAASETASKAASETARKAASKTARRKKPLPKKAASKTARRKTTRRKTSS